MHLRETDLFIEAVFDKDYNLGLGINLFTEGLSRHFLLKANNPDAKPTP